MICLTILLTAKNEADVPRLRDLLAEAMRSSRAEPGCLRFDVYHSTAEPRRFTLVEHWADQAAIDAHRLAEAYTDARANPLWAPLETVLAAQPASPLSPLEPALCDYILLITILVVFLEATAQQRVGRCPLRSAP
jgi:quinol monooxygenase YgiN